MDELQREIAGLRTATAIVAAHRRGDGMAVVELWNGHGQEDPAAVVKALAALPTIIVEELAKACNVAVDLDNYFDHVLRALAAGDN